MDHLRYIAFVSVARACGFALLANRSVMAGLSFDSLMSSKPGILRGTCMRLAALAEIFASVMWVPTLGIALTL